MESLADLVWNTQTPADLSELSAQLTKMTVEAAMGAEMENHLGYAPHEAKGRCSGNSRNGYVTIP